MNHYKFLLALVLLGSLTLVLMVGCASPTPIVIVVTATPLPPTPIVIVVTATPPPSIPTSVPSIPKIPLKIDLVAAESAGRVKLTITGANSIETLNVRLELLDNDPLEVTIAIGTVFEPSNSSDIQSMVVRQSKTVLLTSRGIGVSTTISVSCANMELGVPTSSISFRIRKSPTDSKLIDLLRLPDFSGENIRIQQFAIWTITNNPSRSAYAIVRGWPYPTTDDFQRIKILFNTAGISTSIYRAFSPYTMFINHHTQMCLTIQGNQVVQSACIGSNNQLWEIPAGNNTSIASKLGSCLILGSGNIVLSPCPGASWTLTTFGIYADIKAIARPHPPAPHPNPSVREPGYYYQISINGRCVDVDGWNHSDPGTIIHDTCRSSDNANQLWAFYQ